MKDFWYWDDTTRDIVNAEEIWIYGAGLMGRELLKCLSNSPYSKYISGFLVGDNENNPEKVDGIPVRNVSDNDIDRTALVLVALHEKNLISALETLKRENYTNTRIVSFDSDAWNHIRGNWLRTNGIAGDIVFDDEINKPKICVYVAHSEVDKRIDDVIPFREYEIPIQVGKSLSKKRICLLCDNEGENISEKNRQYCELTALYWVWKHEKSDYIGLSHYRRRFLADSFCYENLKANNIDMVVTMPILNIDGVRTQYGLDHSLDDWDVLMDVIRDRTPEYMEAAEEVQNGSYYYGYNMFIARYDVFCDFCEWLFDILGECEKRIGSKEDPYQNRYIGNLSERMLGMYIRKHKLRVMVADKFFVAK